MSRRRSAFVGFSAVTLTALGGCNDDGSREVSKTVYASVAECKAENPGADCDAAFGEAQAEHAKTAPAFNDRTACEADWGQDNCVEQRREGHSVFLPVMTGFLLGRMLSPGVAPAQGYGPNCPPGDPRCNTSGGYRGGYGGGHAVYVGPRGAFTGGERIGDPEMRNGRYVAPGRVSLSEGPDGRIGPSRVSRGGFGRSARGFGARGG